jgi:hypothetical protein
LDSLSSSVVLFLLKAEVEGSERGKRERKRELIGGNINNNENNIKNNVKQQQQRSFSRFCEEVAFCWCIIRVITKLTGVCYALSYSLILFPYIKHG